MNTKYRARIVISVLVVLSLVGLCAFGCNRDQAIQARGVSNLSSLHLQDDTGTATPIFQVNQTGAGRIMELQDAGTAVAYVDDGGVVTFGVDLTVTDTLDVNGDIDLDGDGFDVNITAGFSIDGDAASNISLSAQDLTIEAETGSITIKGDEAAADAVLIDANDAVTTGLTINVGSVSGVTISGGGLNMSNSPITNIGAAGTDFSGTGGLTLAAALAVTAGGISITDGDMTVADDIIVTAQTAITVTTAAFTPTGTYQRIQAAGTVTPTVNIGTAGQLLVLINVSAQTINIADSGTMMLNTAVALGQYDTLTLWCDGTNWLQIATANN